MLRRTSALLAIVLACVVFAADASAELSAGQKMAADVLIKQFCDRAFAVRQQAVEKLIAIGPDVVPLIQKTLADTDDNEVKVRCQMVLAGIAKKHGIVIEGVAEPAPGAKFGLKAATITLKVNDAALGDVLQELADKSGNKLVKAPEGWDGPRITLDVANMPYWQVLDEMGKQTGLTAAASYRDGGMTLVKVEKQPEPTAYAGPTVVRLDSATKHQTYRNVNRFGGRDGLTYMLTYYWEDRIDALLVTGRITKATLADGAALKLNSLVYGMGAYGSTRTLPTKGMYVSVSDAPRTAERIAEMEGVISFTTGAGKRELRVANALKGANARGSVGNTTLEVTRVNSTQRATFIQVTMTTRGDEKPMLTFPRGSEYGFVLIDPNGGRHAGQSHSYNARQAARVIQQQPGQAVMQVDPQGADEEDDDDRASTRIGSITFQNLPDIEGQWTLVGTLPAETVTKDFTFTLKDVPIP